MNDARSTPSWQTAWRMTRPAFLWLTVAACVLGTATASACGCGLDLRLALATTLLAVIAHAAGNVINDWHDARNGADAANQHGIHPFTGGSRLIQTGQTTEDQTADLARALLMVLVPSGLLLAHFTGPGVLGLGLLGVFLAWAYSAPPLRLMTRGLGELTVALAWFGVVVGADYVQRRHFFVIPAAAGLGFAALVAALLLANSLPDAAADAQVGKRTLAVRLGPRRTAALIAVLALGAHAWLALGVWWNIPPKQALWGLASLPLSLAACVLIARHADRPHRLRPALALTVVATLLHPLAMAWGYAQLAR